MFLHQAQPGFIAGNLISNTDPNEKIWFFEVSSVSEKKVFLNFFGCFHQTKPNFLDSCSLLPLFL
jgi:hypothetical protein